MSIFVIVKRWIAIILLFLHLCSTTELYQFLKIPILIEHYIEHKAVNSDITVYEFLKLHYDHHVKDADWQTDQKLPFITHHDLPTIVFTLQNPFFIEFSHFNGSISKRKIPVYNDAFSDLKFINSVWQPPKFC
ncbi:hypothetical protein [Chryseobacterium sp.]|uniref:hypothetical protein n=1 Tax=Chryseobacterium sp. TaxID=1871047 RepID=UPI00289C0B31|nr:hypothetical protein [Chryseobacterium sp.]